MMGKFPGPLKWLKELDNILFKQPKGLAACEEQAASPLTLSEFLWGCNIGQIVLQSLFEVFRGVKCLQIKQVCF